MNEGKRREMDAIIARGAHRKNVYRLIPEGTRRILDFGCGEGALALRLIRDKGCTEVYGLDVSEKFPGPLRGLLDGTFKADIETQDHIPVQFEGFFNFIVLHDVVEHFRDPWLAMKKLRAYLAPRGRMLVATPNVQFWNFARTILCGDFPYGPGLWHTGHLRWYTVRSLMELVTIAGYSIEDIFLEIPYPLDPGLFPVPGPRFELSLPPAEVAEQHPELTPLTLRFPRDIAPGYALFLAHKMIFVLNARSDMVVEPLPVVNYCPSLAKLRAALDNPYDVYNPPPVKLLIGDWN